MPRLRIRSCGRTDIGLLRERNEDYFEVDDHEKIYLLADGLGGGPHGGLAARMAVDAIHESIARHASTSQAMLRLTRAIERAQARLCDAIQRDPDLIGMGTTVVGLLVENGCRAVVAHVGDSRAYRLRAGKLELLTRDHTVVASLVAKGCLSEREAEGHRLRHLLTRVLSREEVFEVDVSTSSIADGDLFLLCSDGLTDRLSDAEIRSCLTESVGAQKICDRLIKEALERGGQDNITVVLVEFFARGE